MLLNRIHSFIQVLHILIDAGADVSLPNPQILKSEAFTLLHFAAALGNLVAARVGIERGLKVGTRHDGENCLALARRAKHFCQEIWDLLKNAGRRELSDCELCEAKADIQFKPCGHRVCCGSCSSGWSKCVCGAKIEEKSDVMEDPRAFDEALKNEGGSIRKLVQNAGRQIDREKEELAREKEELIREKEELIDDRRCAICLDFPKSYVFASCGHSACSKCQTDLQVCHVCRTQIRDKIRFF